MDPRTPVLVGAGQILNRITDLDDAIEPLGLIEEAVRRAGTDTGADVLAHLDTIIVVDGMWNYPDPGRVIADRVGSTAASTVLTHAGGNVPQQVLSEQAEAIARGEADAVVICGGEAIHSRRKLAADGRDHAWSAMELAPAQRWGKPLDMASDHERSRGIFLPISVYPLFESARRHARGLDHAAHRGELGQLWEGFNRVAVANPNAWTRTAMTADEIVTPTATNRMVGFPYTKAMNANMTVDQAAAVILCSAGWAEARGISRDRWVFPWTGAHASDTNHVSNRVDLHSSPAIRVAGHRALALAGVRVDELGPIDLYSCFPAVVQITCDELGLDRTRQLTLTGGLPMGGGPGNNYVTHGIAQMLAAMRDLPDDAIGMVHANGGLVTKHAFGIYGGAPSGSGFRSESVQPEVAPDHQGAVTVEAYTVMHDADGPTNAILALTTADGQRAWGGSTDVAWCQALMSDEWCGRTVRLGADGSVSAET